MGWEEIALLIAQGALRELGAKIIDSLLGGNGKPDFRAILMEALIAFENILKRQLDREFIGHYQAQLNALVELFQQYKNNTTNSLLREHLRDSAVELTHQLQRFDIQTVPPFCVAGGLALSTLEEIFIQSNDAGDRKNTGLMAEHLVAQRTILQQKLHEFNESRFSQIRAFPGPGITAYQYIDPHGVGQPVTPLWQNTNRAAVEARRNEQIGQEYDIIERQILLPAYPVFETWTEISHKFS